MNRPWCFAACLLPLLVTGCQYLAPPEPVGYPHLLWGNPSGAKADGGDRNNFLMEKTYFALSYNDSKGTPNWVSWRLVEDDLGKTNRNNQQFRADDDLPSGFRKV